MPMVLGLPFCGIFHISSPFGSSQKCSVYCFWVVLVPSLTESLPHICTDRTQPKTHRGPCGDLQSASSVESPLCTEAYIAIILQCFRALIRLNVFLVPLTSVYLPLITILFHCCDIMLTASSSIPVSNKPSSFVCLFVCFCFSPPAPRHLVLVFSTRK